MLLKRQDRTGERAGHLAMKWKWCWGSEYIRACNGIVWLGMVVSGSEAAGIILQPITRCEEADSKVAFTGGIGVMEGDCPVRGWSSNQEGAVA